MSIEIEVYVAFAPCGTVHKKVRMHEPGRTFPETIRSALFVRTSTGWLPLTWSTLPPRNDFHTGAAHKVRLRKGEWDVSPVIRTTEELQRET